MNALSSLFSIQKRRKGGGALGLFDQPKSEGVGEETVCSSAVGAEKERGWGWGWGGVFSPFDAMEAHSVPATERSCLHTRSARG